MIRGAYGTPLGGPIGIQRLDASDTYVPTAGTRVARVTLQAAGGGGAGVGTSAGTGLGGGGGAGETRVGVFDITGNVVVTIGAAGTGGASGNNDGGTASDSTFGALMTAKGGTKGFGSTGATNGAVGTTPTGSGGVAIPPVRDAQSGAARHYPAGSIFGSGDLSYLGATYNGPAVSGKGQGGYGGRDTGTAAKAGGDGSAGFCLIEEFA